MHINEAVKKALESKGFIYRETELKKFSKNYAIVQPTNSYEACILIICKNSKAECGSRCWNPTADDLMADDWTVKEKQEL